MRIKFVEFRMNQYGRGQNRLELLAHLSNADPLKGWPKNRRITPHSGIIKKMFLKFFLLLALAFQLATVYVMAFPPFPVKLSQNFKIFPFNSSLAAHPDFVSVIMDHHRQASRHQLRQALRLLLPRSFRISTERDTKC